MWLFTPARHLPGSVEEAPRARIEPRFIEVNVGEPVTMRCLATGYPEPRLQWLGAINPRASFSDDGVFTIPAARKSDEREYQCVASNRAGEMTVRTVIYVRGGGYECVPDVELSVCGHENSVYIRVRRLAMLTNVLACGNLYQISIKSCLFVSQKGLFSIFWRSSIRENTVVSISYNIAYYMYH